MNKCFILISVLLMSVAVLMLGCSNNEVSYEQSEKEISHEQEVNEVNFKQLFDDPEAYSGQDIIIEGFYFQGWESIILCEGLEYYNGHMINRGRRAWIKGGVPREIYDKAYQQTVSGQLERYAKVRIRGKFEYGGRYGHVGALDAQIVPYEVALVPWSPKTE